MTRKIIYPRKRVVVLELKKSKKTFTYGTCAELAVNNSKSEIGISLCSLWNALSKNKGIFENDLCRIYYRKIEPKINKEWM